MSAQDNANQMWSNVLWIQKKDGIWKLEEKKETNTIKRYRSRSPSHHPSRSGLCTDITRAG